MLAWLPLWLIMTGVAGSSHAQAPPAASISGTVTGLGSSEPIPGVEVALYGRVLAGRRPSTYTDDQGRFAFKDLAPGRYTIGASKAGFASVLHGQRRVGAPGRAWPLAAGEHLEVRLQLPRLSSISGTVLDERGEPLGRAQVQVWQFVWSSGSRLLNSVGGAPAGADGHYRIAGLKPGEYQVCVSSRQTEPLNGVQRLRRDIDYMRRNATFTLGPAGVAAQEQLAPKLAELEARLPARVDPVFGFLPSCQPGSSKGPSMVSLGVEETRTDVNFRLPSTRLARIEGRVNAARPVTPQVGPLMLVNADERLRGGMIDSARPDLDGRFVLFDVIPGRYTLFLHHETEGRGGPRLIAAAAEVIVADQDISDVVLEIRPNATVAGQVVLDGASPRDAAFMAQLRVRLDPISETPSTRYTGGSIASVDAAGRFVLRNVVPGEYRLRGFIIYTPATYPSRWFLKEATVSGEDRMHRPMTIAAGQSITDAVVTLSDRPRATISGTILTEQGEPAQDYWILVYPSDERDRPVHARGMRGIRAGEDGAFAIHGLPPGSYRLVTFLDGDFGDWYDPEFLKRVEGGSTPLTLSEAEQKAVHLGVPGPG